MAKVVQIIATDEKHPHFEPGIINKNWHAVVCYGIGPRTVCGIQLEGEDGYIGGETQDRRVTCLQCRGIIREIQAIRNW